MKKTVTLSPIDKKTSTLINLCGTTWEIVQEGRGSVSRIRCTCGGNHCQNVPKKALTSVGR